MSPDNKKIQSLQYSPDNNGDNLLYIQKMEKSVCAANNLFNLLSGNNAIVCVRTNVENTVDLRLFFVYTNCYDGIFSYKFFLIKKKIFLLENCKNSEKNW